VDLPALQAGWDRAAHEDPLFYILTDHTKRGGGWDPTLFFEHGQREIDTAIAHLDTLGLRHGKRRALDFGCGVGRLTQALAHHYQRVDGVDISPEMIRLANQYGHKGCTYHHNSLPTLPFKAATFDLVYSMIVLQHMPSTLAHGYITEFIRVLKPKGVAMFEIPQGHDYQHSSSPWLSMHGTPRDTIEQWVTDAGARVVDMELIDASTQGYRYTATRKATQ
jgi:ubiquinone/menaquinone biosynthesis C-methylase UbiE